jgi:hypothetical protein
MKTRMFVYLIVALALGAALLSVGCRNREQPPVSPVQPAPVQQPGGQQLSGQQQPAGAANPDLIVSETTVTPTGNPGEVNIHIVSRNQGGPISAAFTVRWHPHEKDKTQVGCSQDFYNLNQSEWVVDCTYAYPSNLSGDMHWVAAVDAENDVKGESNENNNEMMGTVNIPKAGSQPNNGQLPTGGQGGQAPTAPANLRVISTTKTSARLAWDDKSNNEDGFEIDFPGQQNPKTGANETQWEITGLKCASPYNFKVRAFNAAGNSAYSNEVTAQTLACDVGATGPAAPSNLRVTSMTKITARITWTDNANNETGFEIGIEGMQNFSANANATQSEVTGLTCNKSYNFRVRAVNAAGNSAWSNQISGQTLACDVGATAPAAPSNLRVISTTKTTARVAWTDNANNETGFELDLEGRQNPYTLGANETQYEVTGLTCNKANNFRVRATNAAGSSAWSNQVTAQTLACQ